jgi:CRISPR-associated protein Cmr1
MSRQPSVAAPTFAPPAALEQMTLRVRVITPFFGGGYATREIDVINPIRAAAIRGNLRFWWRATAGAQFADAEELFKAEASLWGSDQEYGRVGVKVENVRPGTSKPSHAWFDSQTGQMLTFARVLNKWPGYALQPFQGQKDERPEPRPASGSVGDLFDLTLAFPANRRAEVYLAVSAWCWYGGIGARSRRGCGSLTADLLTSGGPQPVPQPIVASVTRANDDLTILSGAQYVIGPPSSGRNMDAISAWNESIKVYQDFRQGMGFARNVGPPRKPGGPNMPARSKWPEPETLRNLMGQRLPKHGPIAHTPGFPRAELGLPIIFHFQGNDRRRPNAADVDPADATLSGPHKAQARFASPVITKAIYLGNGDYRPLVLVLNAPHVWHCGSLQLTFGEMTHTVPRTAIAHTNIPPMVKNKPIRAALLDYVHSVWGTPVETIP